MSDQSWYIPYNYRGSRCSAKNGKDNHIPGFKVNLEF